MSLVRNSGSCRRRLAAKIPAWLVAGPFEFFVMLCGIVALLTVFFDLDDFEYIKVLGTQVAYVWFTVLFYGVARIFAGIKTDNLGRLTGGALLVSGMVFIYTVTVVIDNRFAHGTMMAGCSAVALFVSSARTLHANRVSYEVKRYKTTIKN